MRDLYPWIAGTVLLFVAYNTIYNTINHRRNNRRLKRLERQVTDLREDVLYQRLDHPPRRGNPPSGGQNVRTIHDRRRRSIGAAWSWILRRLGRIALVTGVLMVTTVISLVVELPIGTGPVVHRTRTGNGSTQSASSAPDGRPPSGTTYAGQALYQPAVDSGGASTTPPPLPVIMTQPNRRPTPAPLVPVTPTTSTTTTTCALELRLPPLLDVCASQ